MKEKSPEFAGIAQGFQKGSRSRLVGELKLLAVDSGAVIATLKYELNTTEQLGKAITNFQVPQIELMVTTLGRGVVKTCNHSGSRGRPEGATD